VREKGGGVSEELKGGGIVREGKESVEKRGNCEEKRGVLMEGRGVCELKGEAEELGTT